MCKNTSYYWLEKGTPTGKLQPFKVLQKQFDSSSIKRFIINKQLVLIPCGKCPDCVNLKKTNYVRRVKSQLKMYKFSYLITITLDNQKQFTLLDNITRTSILNKCSNSSDFSSYTNLSKINIDNIIKNWKNKINRFYKEKVRIHYFLCGEYGSRTQRAHYHILLMLDRPLPNLVREPVAGCHFKSSIIDSKQYSLYDIQITNGSVNCSSYISKYLLKSYSKDKKNYNRFEEKQIRFLLSINEPIDKYFLFKNKEQMIKYLVYYWLASPILIDFIYSNIRNGFFKSIKKQSEFVKSSRCLGISSDLYFNYLNKVFNSYYYKKYFANYSSVLLSIQYFCSYHKNIMLYVLLFQLLFYMFLYYSLLFKMLELRKNNNLIKYYGMSFVNNKPLYLKYDIM